MHNLLIFIVLASILQPAIAQDVPTTTSATGTLRVVVKGLDSSEGTVAIALFNTEAGYKSQKEPFRDALAPITDQDCEWVVEDLPYGEYAIMLFHDENGNGKMDTNLIGIPQEDYGFSNNAKGRFGPPGYDKAHFIFNEETLTIEINV